VWLAPMREGEFVREGIEKERGAKREFMAPVGLFEFYGTVTRKKEKEFIGITRWVLEE